MKHNQGLLITILLLCLLFVTRSSNSLSYFPHNLNNTVSSFTSNSSKRESTFTTAINLTVREESPAGTLIATLATLLSHRLHTKIRIEAPKPLSLTLLRGAPFVSLDSRMALVVASRIDRENPILCPPPTKPINTTADTCTFLFSVLVQTTGAKSGSSRPLTVTLPIEVLDIDDNIPQFPVARIDAFVLENVPVGSLVLSAPIARDADADIAHRTSVEYTLNGPNAQYFSVIHNHNSSIESLSVYTAKLIDREQLGTNPTLTVQILATSATRQQHLLQSLQSTEQQPLSMLTVNVSVIDVNEFDPVFVELPVEPIHLSENSETGTEVWRVEARDSDSDSEPIEFRFGAAASDSVRRAFSLDRVTGRILVASAQELDYERTREFILPIEAVDAPLAISATPTTLMSSRSFPLVSQSRRTATATIHIVLENMNDNPPIITLSIPSSMSTSELSGSNSKMLAISEAVPIGTFLAAITAIDFDEIDGTKILCRLQCESIEEQVFHLDILEIGLLSL